MNGWRFRVAWGTVENWMFVCEWGLGEKPTYVGVGLWVSVLVLLWGGWVR